MRKTFPRQHVFEELFDYKKLSFIGEILRDGSQFIKEYQEKNRRAPSVYVVNQEEDEVVGRQRTGGDDGHCLASNENPPEQGTTWDIRWQQDGGYFHCKHWRLTASLDDKIQKDNFTEGTPHRTLVGAGQEKNENADIRNRIWMRLRAILWDALSGKESETKHSVVVKVESAEPNLGKPYENVALLKLPF